jgi:hypothetical protein
MVSCGTRFLDTRCSIYSWTGPKAGLAALVWSSVPVTGAFIVLSLFAWQRPVVGHQSDHHLAQRTSTTFSIRQLSRDPQALASGCSHGI